MRLLSLAIAASLVWPSPYDKPSPSGPSCLAAGTFAFAWTDEWWRGGKAVTDWWAQGAAAFVTAASKSSAAAWLPACNKGAACLCLPRPRA